MSSPIVPAGTQTNLFTALALDPRGVGEKLRQAIDFVSRDLAATKQNVMDIPKALSALGGWASDPRGALDDVGSYVGRDLQATWNQLKGIPPVAGFLQGLQGAPDFSGVRDEASFYQNPPSAGRPLPEEAQGLGPLVEETQPQTEPGYGSTSIPYNVPKLELPEPEALPRVDFSEVSKILDEARPEDLPPVSKAEMVVSILGALAGGMAEGDPRGTGYAIGRGGAAAAGAYLQGRQEDARRKTVNQQQRARYEQYRAAQRAQQVLANAGIDAQNVQQMNAYRERKALADFEYSKAMLPQIQISNWAITTMTPDPETGRLVINQTPGPAYYAAQMATAARVAAAARRGLGMQKPGDISDITIGLNGIRADTMAEPIAEMNRAAAAWAMTNIAERQKFEQAVQDGEIPGTEYLIRLKFEKPEKYFELLIGEMATRRMLDYQNEFASQGTSNLAEQDFALIKPLNQIKAERSTQSREYLMQQFLEDESLGDALDPYVE